VPTTVGPLPVSPEPVPWEPVNQADSLSPDHVLAADIATAAGKLLLQVREEMADADPTERKDAGDRRAHELIMELLAVARPGDAVLSEEGKDDLARLDASRVWIVDPLDGTREFGEIPRTDWAVHVALTVDGLPVAGAVALPGLDLTLSTAVPPTPPPAHGGAPRVIASRTRPGPAAEAIAEAIGGELVFMGSAGAKAMAVVRGEAEVYAHTGGQYEWDNCAPTAVAAAAGLHASRLDGSPLTYNNENPYLPDLLICRPEYADAAIAIAGGL
jgi:3'(2'), 5'-bisphosphate nucleotidase